MVIEPQHGRVIAKLGDFGGIDTDGAPIGFLWSNSLVFHGDDVLVTNLSLDVGPPEASGPHHLAVDNNCHLDSSHVVGHQGVLDKGYCRSFETRSIELTRRCGGRA